MATHAQHRVRWKGVVDGLLWGVKILKSGYVLMDIALAVLHAMYVDIITFQSKHSHETDNNQTIRTNGGSFGKGVKFL